MLTRKTRRLVLPDALLKKLGRIHSPLARDFGVMPMQAFLQRVQAFLAELARPHLLPEAAALMEREGGLEQMEPLLDWVPGASQEVFALQDGPSRPTSVDPPLARAESAPVEEETGPPAPEGEPEAGAPLSPTSPARTPTKEVESEEEAARA